MLLISTKAATRRISTAKRAAIRDPMIAAAEKSSTSGAGEHAQRGDDHQYGEGQHGVACGKVKFPTPRFCRAAQWPVVPGLIYGECLLRPALGS